MPLTEIRTLFLLGVLSPLMGAAWLANGALSNVGAQHTSLTTRSVEVQPGSTEVAEARFGDRMHWNITADGASNQVEVLFLLRMRDQTGSVVEASPHLVRGVCERCGGFAVEVNERSTVHCDCGRCETRIFQPGA